MGKWRRNKLNKKNVRVGGNDPVTCASEMESKPMRTKRTPEKRVSMGALGREAGGDGG